MRLISVMPAMNRPSTRLLVTTVHCTIASGSRFRFNSSAAEAMLASVHEGAVFLLDHGVMPLYSPLWPVTGTAYPLDKGLQPELYLQLEMGIYRLRRERDFPVPSWLTCTGCSYMLLEVDFDHELGLVHA